jgi:hypothetical protein
MPRLPFSCALFLASCATTRPPCYGNTCNAGFECLANRCVPVSAAPVPPQSDRVVLDAVAIAVVSSSDPNAHSLPPTVSFGSAMSGNVTIYLRFADDWKQGGEILSAFLLLEPTPSTYPDPDDTTLDVWTVHEAWQPEGVTWRNRPRIGIPHRPALARSSPPTLLRIDVTEIARHLQGRPGDFGLAVAASAGPAYGATFYTGAAGGVPPRLELYLRRREAPTEPP